MTEAERAEKYWIISANLGHDDSVIARKNIRELGKV